MLLCTNFKRGCIPKLFHEHDVRFAKIFTANLLRHFYSVDLGFTLMYRCSLQLLSSSAAEIWPSCCWALVIHLFGCMCLSVSILFGLAVDCDYCGCSYPIPFSCLSISPCFSDTSLFLCPSLSLICPCTADLRLPISKTESLNIPVITEAPDYS